MRILHSAFYMIISEVVTIIRLYYESEYGKLQLNDNFIKCLQIEGLNFPEKEINVVGYVGESGQTTISKKDMARTITISGDLVGGKNQLAYANRVLYYDGHLVFTFDQKVRKIACKCTSFPDPERFGKDFKRIVMQFICDKPEFTDFVNTRVFAFGRTNEVLTKFTLKSGVPCVFTSSTYETDVYNSGDLNCEPIFYITVERSGANITIYNDTTGQHITLNYSFTEGETVIIDIDKRTIKNTDDANLINYISDDTFLSEFWLQKGINRLRLTKGTPALGVSIICEFSNKYIEAVY